MTEKEYRSHPAISRSELWHMHESPEKFKWYREYPPAPTSALLFGQVVHKLILQADDFSNDFIVWPGLNRTTKAGKEAWAQFLQIVGDRQVVDKDGPNGYNRAVEMANKVLSNPVCKRLLNGDRERPFFWTDADTGEACKCRVDCLTETEDGLVIVDYKTANNADTDIFNHSIWKYGYHFQAAMYSEGVMQCLELTERPQFVFIVQEKTMPYSVNVVTVPPEVMLAGLDTFRELIGIYHECKETGYWYGYTGPFNEPNEAYLPGWMSMGEEEDE